MISRRTVLLGAAAASLAACAQPRSRFLTYDGPPVTSVIVNKSRRTIWVMNGNRALETFRMELGFAPVGHKQFEGDGKTPEGAYYIDRRNPNSNYHLSIGINYPNDADREYARSFNRSPGGDIFIHGTPDAALGRPDWTAGCMAVTNAEVERIYAMVRDGTPVFIHA